VAEHATPQKEMANEELLVSPIGDISGDVCH
jgi:hypothetical protein